MSHTVPEITKALNDGIAAGKLDTTPGNVFRSAWPAAKEHGYHGTLHDVFTAGYLSVMPAEGVTVYSTGVVVERPIVYLSCQYCHKPAGDRQTKENGYCQDCKAEIVSAGHERERLATGHA